MTTKGRDRNKLCQGCGYKIKRCVCPSRSAGVDVELSTTRPTGDPLRPALHPRNEAAIAAALLRYR